MDKRYTVQCALSLPVSITSADKISIVCYIFFTKDNLVIVSFGFFINILKLGHAKSLNIKKPIHIFKNDRKTCINI